MALAGWGKRIKITINNTDIISALADFPILIYISTSSGENAEDITAIFDELGANSKKIAVTEDDEETQCYVEIENWDEVGEQAWLWVKVPNIASAEPTDLYVYYDNTQDDNTDYVGDPESAAGEQVWDSNFKMVQHMQDVDTSNIHDSTDNDNDGAKHGANEPIEADGKVHKAQEFDGVDDDADCGTDSSLDITGTEITLEAWIYPQFPTTVKRYYILNKHARAVGGYAMTIYRHNVLVAKLAAALDTTERNDEALALSSNSIYENTWYYVVFVWDGVTAKHYINGGQDGSEAIGGTLKSNPSKSLYIGEPGGAASNQKYFDGIMDEVRVSDTNRSVAWINACYETQRDDLLDFGGEEIMAGGYTLHIYGGGVIIIT